MSGGGSKQAAELRYVISVFGGGAALARPPSAPPAAQPAYRGGAMFAFLDSALVAGGLACRRFK